MQIRNRPPPSNTALSSPSISFVRTEVSPSSRISSSSWATSCAFPVIVPTRIVRSKGMPGSRSAAARTRGRTAACVFRDVHYNACQSSTASTIFHRSAASRREHPGANVGAREPSRKPPRKENGTVVELDADYLRRLGERVRQSRARRGMTRKILARDSGVSERYLAQLESGRGNASVLLLRQIARALNLPVGDLVQDENGQPVELTLIQQFLERLPAREARRGARASDPRVRLLLRRAAQPDRPDRPARRGQVDPRRAARAPARQRLRRARPRDRSRGRARACTRSSCSTGSRASGATSAAPSSARSRTTSAA